MYWFKPTNCTGAALCMLLIYSCKPEVNPTASYFDLQKYFTAETARLKGNNKPIIKTVDYNNATETKTMLIKNWPRELALFASSDINKPAWKNSYTTQKNNDSVSYKAIDTNLHTRQITIITKAGKVSAIMIRNFTKNMLYQTREKLTYYPDSLYYIEKHQEVKLLGVNNYLITGRFK